MNNIDQIKQFLNSPFNTFYFMVNIIVICCFLFVVAAIIIDFVEFHKRDNYVKKKNSIVETGSMFLFYFALYALLRFKIGVFLVDIVVLRMLLIITGTIILLIGCYFNIKGRMILKHNWSNQIRIYSDHTFVSSGVYSIVRHPLYASLIWMFYGAGFIYHNYGALLLNTFIFIPMMYYRAKQEEELLIKQFDGYIKYSEYVGMFFPKIKFNSHDKI